MNNRKTYIKFKTQFKTLNFYSMPKSILFIVRKRLNFVFFSISLILSLFFTLF